MAIVRNSLVQGNNEVKDTIKSSKSDHSLTFDKIVAMMYETCLSKISDKQVSSLLHPDSLLVYKEELSELIEFNKNIFLILGPEPVLSEHQNEIMNLINDVR